MHPHVIREEVLKEIESIRENNRDLFFDTPKKNRKYDDYGIAEDGIRPMYPRDLDFKEMEDIRLIKEYTTLVRRACRQR
jgi:hypothetical protein